MRKVVFSLFLLFPLILSLPTTTRILQEWGYTKHGKDWTSTCASGREQSPIDIQTKSASCDDSVLFDLYVTAGAQTFPIIDTGETIKATTNVSTEYATDVDGVLTGYQSAQFHFHAPSEHRINGKTYDLEMHFLHSINTQFSSRGLTPRIYAVVGILFEVDDTAGANAFIDALNLNAVNEDAAISVTVDLKTKLFDTLPKPATYYTYEGSLTTPPCSEIVNWYVISTPQKIKSSQLASITKRYAGNEDFASGNGNNRDPQLLHGRVVKHGGTICTYNSNLHELSSGAIGGVVLGSVAFGIIVAAVVFFTRKFINRKSKESGYQVPSSPLTPVGADTTKIGKPYEA